MDSSQLLEGWRQFQSEYPGPAGTLKQSICTLYGSRQEPEKFDAELAQLQKALAGKASEALNVDASDRQAVVTWASAMGFIFLVKKEHNL